MKTSISIILLTLIHFTWSQNIETRIKNVENSLTFPSTVLANQEIIKSNINEAMKQNKIHGASVAVINDGKIEWLKGYGLREVGGSDKVTTETLFQCASIGKPITAIAILKLVEAGKIDLDENVNNKLQRWKIKDNKFTKNLKVTLRHLLSHSSGLNDGYGFSGYDSKDEIPTLLQILNGHRNSNSKKSHDIKTIPGKTERYSGAGYLIIQVLIEDISGLSFADYVQQHIFEPLKMLHSTYDFHPDKNLGLPIAAGHRSNGKQLRNKKYNIYPEHAAAGPWTTAEDLAKLIIGVQEAYNGKANPVLNQKLTHEFLTTQINNKGLGVNLKGVEKPQAFWHAGQNLGYTALLYGLIEKREGAVILLNSDGGEGLMQEFMTSVAMEYDWPVINAYKAQKIPNDLRSNLIGKYENTDKSRTLFVSQKNGIITLKPSGAIKGYQLYRIKDNSYTFKDSQDYFRVSFHLENGTTTLKFSESIGKITYLKKSD